MMSFGTHFSEKARRRTSAFGLRRRVRIAYEPTPGGAETDPKTKEKNKHMLEHVVFAKIDTSKTRPKMYPKRVLILGTLGVAPLWRRSGPFLFLIVFVTSEMGPRRPQGALTD